MSTIHENLTSQIDGVTDTFTTANDISGGVVVDHDGQVVSPVDITILTDTSFRLSFVPQSVPNGTDTLGVFFTPDLFDISSQVDGVATVFFADVGDLGQGEFLAVLNGQILADQTRTLNTNSFSLPTPPQIGDKLLYFRVIDLSRAACSDIVIGVVNATVVVGVVNEPDQVLGIINT